MEKMCSFKKNCKIIGISAKCGISLRFWNNKGWIDKTDPYGWFHFRGAGYVEDQ